MPHVEKRSHTAKDGKRSIRWRLRYETPDGHLRSETFPRKVDAERRLIEVENSKLYGTWVDPALGATRLDAWAWQWFEGVAPALTAKTRASYRSLLGYRILPVLGTYTLAGVRRSHVQAWVSGMQADRLSASRIRQSVVVLGQILDAAADEGMVVRNAARGVKLPPVVRREAAYFEPAVVDAIAGATRAPYDLLIRILGVLGPRWGEAAGLRRRSVDLLRRRLVVDGSLSEVAGELMLAGTKSHAVRQLPIPPSLVQELQRHLDARVGPAADALIFTSPNGGPLRHSNYYRRIWIPTLRRLGLPVVGLHVLRHSAAARMIASGGSPKAVQVVLGHADPGFTLRVYGHLFDSDLDALAQRLDEVGRNSPTPNAPPMAPRRLPTNLVN